MMKRRGVLFSLALLLAFRTAVAGPMEEIQKLQDEIFKMKIQQEKLQQEINNYQLKGQLSSTLSSISLNRLMNEVSKIQQEISLLQEKIELEKTKLREAKELGQALMVYMPYKGTAMGKYLITDNGVIEAGSNFGLGRVKIKHGGIVKVGPYYLTNENTTEGNTSNMPISPMGPMGGSPMPPMSGSPMPPSPPSGGPPSLPPLPPLTSLVGNGSAQPPPSGPMPPPVAQPPGSSPPPSGPMPPPVAQPPGSSPPPSGPMPPPSPPPGSPPGPMSTMPPSSPMSPHP